MRLVPFKPDPVEVEQPLGEPHPPVLAIFGPPPLDHDHVPEHVGYQDDWDPAQQMYVRSEVWHCRGTSNACGWAELREAAAE